MAIVKVDEEGRLTLPAEALEVLRIAGETAVAVEVNEETGAITLTPAEDDDSWLYTEETFESLRRARQDIEAGRVQQMTEAELREFLNDSRE